MLVRLSAADRAPVQARVTASVSVARLSATTRLAVRLRLTDSVRALMESATERTMAFVAATTD